MASAGPAPQSDPRALASFARSPELPPASVWGEPNGHRLDSRGWVCPTTKAGTRTPGGQSVCTPPLAPICLRFLVLSELDLGSLLYCNIPHLVKLIKQLLCLSSVVYQSWWVSRLRGVHNAA